MAFGGKAHIPIQSTTITTLAPFAPAWMPALIKNGSIPHASQVVECSSYESPDQPVSYRIGGVDLLDSPLLEPTSNASGQNPTPQTEFWLENHRAPRQETTSPLAVNRQESSDAPSHFVPMSTGTQQPYFVRLPSSPACISIYPPLLQPHLPSPGSLSGGYRCHFEGCGKAFKSAWHLHSHNKHHTNERDFNCDLPSCGAKFQRRHDLLRHLKSVHSKTEDRTITCVCGKSFGRLDSLRRHQVKICPYTKQ